jgi:hypothetical protein
VQLSESAAWNLATLVLMTVAVTYGYKVFSFLKSGQIGKSYALSLCSLCAMWTTFLIKFIFSVTGVSPVEEFGVSVTDLGSMISAAFLVLSLRQTSRFWRIGKRPQAVAARSPIPVRTEYPLSRKLKN